MKDGSGTGEHKEGDGEGQRRVNEEGDDDDDDDYDEEIEVNFTQNFSIIDIFFYSAIFFINSFTFAVFLKQHCFKYLSSIF